MPLSFAQANFALAFVTGVSMEKAGSFEARIKQWQKMGFPEGVNVGRGVKASYGATQIFQLLIMLKLLRVGLTPQRAQQVVISGWPKLKDAVVETLSCMANGSEHLHYCLIQLDALSELTSPDTDHMHVYVDLFTSDDIGLAFTVYEEEDEASPDDVLIQQYYDLFVKNRLAVSISLEMDSLLILLWSALEACGSTPEVFADELAIWYEEREARGRSQQNSDHFDLSHAARSVARHQSKLNAVSAARLALSKVPGDSHDQHPQA